MAQQHPLEQLSLAPLRRLSGHLEHLVQTHLWARVLIGLVAGIAIGAALGPSVGLVSPRIAMPLASWLALPGALFLALVQMIVVPLVFSSVVRGLAAGESVDQLRRMGVAGAVFFVSTTAVATALGLGLGLLVQPGRFLDAQLVRSAMKAEVAIPSEVPSAPGLGQLPDAFIGLLPTNPLASMVGGEMLQVILFAFVVGIALVNLAPEKSAPLFDLLGSVQEICMTIVAWAMRLAPFAVFGLVARLTSTVGLEVLGGMAVYVLTVLAGLALMMGAFVVLTSVAGRMGPGRFLVSVREVVLLAFSTSSSAAVMPLSIQTAEEKLGVRPAIARFLVPLGATVNMNGTALYQGVATVFLAQVFDVPLTVFGLLLVVVTAVSASIGSPATPGAGIVILAMVLEGAGIPTSGLALILGVDRILDMSRTAINVTGDLTACVVLDRWTSEDAEPLASGLAEET
ncbi:MAG: dicarboxylate/amino acid:cation symporter [Deltaproteobacteria bacterium]|jgi:Na+/H+-dicarboxylate symporter|nr:dicarboxylate/amino acid:cation symporter [Deltaproteobacteria bacterium]MBW2500078.1 dicarboxylate/amino acid:cation symporter [Deltaproteobacteria bacterium]